MKTILHVGMTKTGSTALQAALSAARNELREAGIVYPDIPGHGSFKSHHLLTWRFALPERIPVHVRRHFDTLEDMHRAYRALRKSIRADVRMTAPAGVVMSSEHLFRPLGLGQRLAIRADFFRMGLRDTTVAVYLRLPSSRYLSMMQQGLKGLGVLRQPNRPEYRKPFSSFVTLFGRAAIEPKVFARGNLIKGDVLVDFEERFLRPLGAPEGILRPASGENATLSAEGMQVMEWRRQDEVDRGDQGFSVPRLRHCLDDVEPLADVTRAHLEPRIAECIDYCSDGVHWLREEWGLAFEGYDYDRIAAGDLAPRPPQDCSFKDIVQVDAERTLSLLDVMIERNVDPAVSAWADRIRTARRAGA